MSALTHVGDGFCLALQHVGRTLVPVAGTGKQRFACQHPVGAADGSHRHIGHCRIAFRTLDTFAAAAAPLLQDTHDTLTHAARGDEADVAIGAVDNGLGGDETHAQGRADSTAGAVIADKVSGDPGKWPTDRTQHVIISILSIQLRGPWAEAPQLETFTVFWNFLDSFVDSHMEATRRVPRVGAVLSVGDTTQYNVGGRSEDARAAQVPRRLSCTMTLQRCSCITV
jgi:hypothetical protein